MNAHVERFNRTVQEQFVDNHDDLLFTDFHAFNKKLAEWCVTYNTVTPPPQPGPPLSRTITPPIPP
ncbi:MAG: integrase core domain-containing protein [Pseudomonadota bacterium]